MLRDSATMGVEQNRPISTPGVRSLPARRRPRDRSCHELAAGAVAMALHGGDHGLRQKHDGLAIIALQAFMICPK